MTINCHNMQDLSEDKDEIMLTTHLDTELHIIQKSEDTLIVLPNNNRVDFIDGKIIIKNYGK